MGKAPERPAPDLDDRLGRLALERGFVTPLQLQEAVDLRDRDGLTLREVLLGTHLLTNAQFIRLQVEASLAPVSPPVGRFSIVRELGRGCSAVVYEAVDTADGRRVALKVFHPGPAAEIDRFLREGFIASKIPSHPGIVAVHEAGEADGRRYLVMDLVDGLHMDLWIRQGSVTFPSYITILRDAALAVDHAHHVGVIHRDLKPENILVDKDGRARVTDFGLAKSVTTPEGASLTATGVALGTPAYMSPEQIQGRKDVDRRTDVWALGVMLYEGLTGERPFPGATAFEAMTKAVHEPPAPPARITRLQMNPLLFGTVERITLKALAKDPRDRYPSARAFAGDLDRWLKGERFDVEIPAAPKPPRARKPAALVAAALLGALLATALLLGPRGEPVLPALGGSTFRGRPGAVLEYFGGIHFNTLGKREVDARPRFGDPADSEWPNGPEYYVSRRWTGRLRVPETGAYRFRLRAHEGASLTVARAELVSNLVPNMPTERGGRVVLEKGLHDLVLEAFHTGAPEEVVVAWGREGGTEAALGPQDLLHEPASFTPVAAPALNGPVIIPGAQEGEALEIASDGGRKTSVQPFSEFRWFWRGRWSGTSHLWWGSGTRKGDTLALRFQAPAGRRAIVLGLTRSMDHGVFRIAVNGAPMAEPVDLFSADLATLDVVLPAMELRTGANELTFTAVGSNPAAREWGPGGGLHKLGLDYVLVR